MQDIHCLRVADITNRDTRTMKAAGYHFALRVHSLASIRIIVRDSDKSSLRRLRELESPVVFELDELLQKLYRSKVIAMMDIAWTA